MGGSSPALPSYGCLAAERHAAKMRLNARFGLIKRVCVSERERERGGYRGREREKARARGGRAGGAAAASWPSPSCAVRTVHATMRAADPPKRLLRLHPCRRQPFCLSIRPSWSQHPRSHARSLPPSPGGAAWALSRERRPVGPRCRSTVCRTKFLRLLRRFVRQTLVNL